MEKNCLGVKYQALGERKCPTVRFSELADFFFLLQIITQFRKA